MQAHASALVAASLLLLACGGTTGDGGGMMNVGGGSGGGMMAVALKDLPTGLYLDVQPLSPRSNTSYGFEAFLGKPVVVTLLEGF